MLYASLINYSRDSLGLYATAVCFIWISTLLLYQFSGLYQFDAILKPFASLDKVIVSIVTALLFLLAAAFSMKVTSTLSRVWIVVFGISVFASTFSVRLVLSGIVLRLSHQGIFTRNVVIVGNIEHIERLVQRTKETRPDFVSILGVFVDGPSRSDICGVPLLGTLRDVEPWCAGLGSTMSCSHFRGPMNVGSLPCWIASASCR